MHKQLLLLLAALVSFSAYGQLRSIPDNAKRATMSHVREMQVTLNGEQVVLAAGAQIRGANNLIITPTQLPPYSLVKYQLDNSGLVARVWVLTPEETARPDSPQAR